MSGDTDLVALTMSRWTLHHALNCLDALADDEREPERYRGWYREAAEELRAALDVSTWAVREVPDEG